MLTKKQSIILLACLMGAVVLVGIFREARAAEEVWNSTFEGSPANGDPISAGASKIRDTRENTRARLQVEHFVGGTAASEDDDNGLHRLGSARCYMTESAPTGLFDSHSGITLITDLTDLLPAGTGVGDLANTSTGAAGAGVEDDVGQGRCWIDTDGADGNTNDECTGAGTSAGTGSPVDATPACCTAVDAGTCDLDDNKMYIYLGVAGDAGTPPTGLDAGWQQVITQVDPADITDSNAFHIKEHSPNYLTNGDFEWNATDAGTACDSTTIPSQWTAVGSETFTYITIATEGNGCAVVITDTAGSEGITQTLDNLQGSSDYRVTARVDAAAADDICTLTVTGAASASNGSHTGTTLETITSTFTTSAAVDDVTIGLISTASGDICTWDHVKVARETRPEIPDAGVIAVYDTFTTSPATLDSACVGADDPIDCCTGAGTGDCDIDATFQKVPELSISFNPPTPGWIVQVGAAISIGCLHDCLLAGATDEGYTCHLAKDGAEISGTLMLRQGDLTGNTFDFAETAVMNTIEINPVVGTDIVYTAECRENAPNSLLYNPIDDIGTTGTSHSNLWMMAYPPH